MRKIFALTRRATVGGSVGRRGTRAGRLLFQLVLDEFKDELTSIPTSVYMQLAVYDLIGEIFTPSDPKAVSLYTDKQFGRVCAIIKDRFADPDLRPRDVAAEAASPCAISRSSLHNEALPAAVS